MGGVVEVDIHTHLNGWSCYVYNRVHKWCDALPQIDNTTRTNFFTSLCLKMMTVAYGPFMYFHLVRACISLDCRDMDRKALVRMLCSLLKSVLWKRNCANKTCTGGWQTRPWKARFPLTYLSRSANAAPAMSRQIVFWTENGLFEVTKDGMVFGSNNRGQNNSSHCCQGAHLRPLTPVRLLSVTTGAKSAHWRKSFIKG